MSEETITKIMGEDKRGKKVSRPALYKYIFDQVNKAYDPKNLKKVHNLYKHWSGDGVSVEHLADISYLANIKTKFTASEGLLYKTIADQIAKYVNCVFGEIQKNLKTESEEFKKIFPKINPATILSWLNTSGKKPGDDSRIALYMISFAYNLPYDENWNTDPEIDKNGEPVVPEPQNLSHQYLFSHIFRMKPLIKTPLEFCLTYCKCKGLTIKDAYNLFSKYLKEISESNKTVGGTRTLFADILTIEDENEFIEKLRSSNMTIMPDKVKEQINTNLKTKDGKNMNFNKLWSNANKKDSPLYISFDSAFRKSSGQTGNIIQLRKILILSFYYWFYFTNENIYKVDERTFKFFIKSLDRELSRLNLPEFYILDDFDRTMIISAAAPKAQDAVNLFNIIAEVVPPEML